MGFPPGGHNGSKRLETPTVHPTVLPGVKRELLIYIHARGMKQPLRGLQGGYFFVSDH